MTRRPPPTIGAARTLLEEARRKLARGENRQAAETGWLAAVTAGRAMLRHASDLSPSVAGRIGRVVERVDEVEKKHRMKGRISAVISLVRRDLHGIVFLGGVKDEDWSGAKAIEREFSMIARVIENVGAFSGAARRKPARRSSGTAATMRKRFSRRSRRTIPRRSSTTRLTEACRPPARRTASLRSRTLTSPSPPRCATSA